MDIKLKSLNITNYDSKDIEKIEFINTIKSDYLINKYLYRCIDEMIEKSETSENFVLGYGYIVKDNDKLIGFFRPARLESKYKIDVDYGIIEKYRNKGYGTKLLIEVSDYLLTSFDMINGIVLHIDNSNKNSVKCALNAGFIKTSLTEVDNFQTYMKRRG